MRAVASAYAATHDADALLEALLQLAASWKASAAAKARRAAREAGEAGEGGQQGQQGNMGVLAYVFQLLQHGVITFRER